MASNNNGGIYSTELKRLIERESRKEHQRLQQRCNAIGFEYVVHRPPQARVCFGSAVTREILPMGGKALNSFMSRILPKNTGENVGPGTYEVSYFTEENHPVLKKRVNKKGLGGLALRMPRFKSFDQKETYKTDQKIDQIETEKQSFKPFSSSINRPCFTPNNPGVGTYIFKNKKYIYRHSFGGKIKTIPASITLCTPQNLDFCSICNEQPNVDYWKHFEDGKNLCRSCMKAEIDRAKYSSKTKVQKFKKLEYLNEYKRVRYCSYYHNHEKTTAAVQFIPSKVLKKKFRLESYLSQFEFGFK